MHHSSSFSFLFLLFFFLFIYSYPTSSSSLSIIITVQPSKISDLSLCLYSLDFAINEYQNYDENISLSIEIIISKLSKNWNDNELDILYRIISSFPFSKKLYYTNIIIIDNNNDYICINNNSFSCIINESVKQSSGEFLLFLTHTHQVSSNFLNLLLSKYDNNNNMDNNIFNNKINEWNLCIEHNSFESCIYKKEHLGIGIISGKQISQDNRIVDCGIDFRIYSIDEKQYNKNEIEFTSQFSQGERYRKSLLYSIYNNSNYNISKYTALPVSQWRGEHSNYYPCSTMEYMKGISGTFFLMKRDLFTIIGGIDEQYSSLGYDRGIHLGIVDMSLYLYYLGFDIIYEPQSVAISSLDLDLDKNINDEQLFTYRWNIIREQIEKQYIFNNTHINYRFECGTSGVLGFTVESINLILGLENYIPISIGNSDSARCIRQLTDLGLQSHKAESIRRLSDIMPDKNEKDTILIIHKDPGRYQGDITRSKLNPYYIIGRSMYETDGIPSHWVSPIEKHVDEIWVPTKFNKDTFSKSGINKDNIKIIGEGLDIHSFDPNLSDNILHLGSIEQFSGYNISYSDKSDLFTFLCIMKFESRKGWKELITAYIEEFRETEVYNKNIRLLFRTNIIKHEQRKVEVLVSELEEKYGKAPPIYFAKEPVSFQKLPELYNMADAIVSASHGEGWGLPLMESMAMKKPTIAVNWGGNTEFMNNNNSFLVNIEGLTSDDTVFSDHKWANLSLNHLKYQMRYVYENKNNIQDITNKARDDISNNWNISTVSYNMAKMLKEIVKNKEYYKKQKILREVKHLNKDLPQDTKETFIKDGTTFFTMKIIK